MPRRRGVASTFGTAQERKNSVSFGCRVGSAPVGTVGVAAVAAAGSQESQSGTRPNSPTETRALRCWTQTQILDPSGHTLGQSSR